MKQYLLPQSGHFYKANLHSHSIISDGKQTPEEMKQAYMAQGYSIIAYTDHEKLVDHSDLCDEHFLALNSVEVGVYEPKETVPYPKHCHLGFIALRQSPLPEEFWCDANTPMDGKIPRVYSRETVNALICRGRELGFFVTYNHPGWSMENYNDYMNYHGMHAMEIINGTGTKQGFSDHTPHVYDDMLRGNKRIFCIAADDNHKAPDLTSYRNGCGIAFTVIKAETLSYNAITDALIAGHFYASEAPEIYDLWYENGWVYVKTSDAHRIFLNTGRRRCKYFGADNDGTVTQAAFEVFPEDIYFRITVQDKRGRFAHTNAYFWDEINVSN